VLLRPVHLDVSLIGHLLPWDLFTSSGVLVARSGVKVMNALHFAELSARPLFRRASDQFETANKSDNPYDKLRRLIAELDSSLQAAGTIALEPAIRAHARTLIHLSKKDRDALLGLARLAPAPDPALRHCLLVAIIAIDLAHTTGFPERNVETLAAAALTMNVAALRLHAELATGMEQYDEITEADIRRHPERSARLLEVGGLSDADWLATVRQHHENLDGSGYPGGLSAREICAAARLIRVVDFYVAKLSGRRNRRPKTAQIALRHILLGNERQRLDAQYAVPLLRRYGLYPAGTLVRLANREIAVIVRNTGKNVNSSVAMSFMQHRGRKFAFPIERDIDTPTQTVVEVLEIDSSWPEMPWEAFWGYMS
jgi:HD-GYP domain-containing protein (c-di-GMP phosphodiesterase class II)